MTALITRTTVALPVDLLNEITKCDRNRNSFVVTALRHELEARKRAAIDAAFAGMADDVAYLAQAEELAEEFADADFEALALSEAGR